MSTCCAAKSIPGVSQFSAAYQNYALSKVGQTQEDFLQKNKAAADDAAMRFAPYCSNSPQFRQQGGGGGGGAPFRQHGGGGSGGHGGGGGNFGRRNSAPAQDRLPHTGSGPD
ncbi:hypothetical protein PLESTB_000348200 [Pleodorina starrii]|uniref:Uncharacterized protein n=1 Tax=Pleodorina starrii TaxID=330485 RepID=A0A9W6BEA5_9CHLO|nr:hypothetical protein PLESTB_000348200 [Pleodorina starrii]